MVSSPFPSRELPSEEVAQVRGEADAQVLKVYAEAYPDAKAPSGSILVFGLVAKERYNDSFPGLSNTHKHCASFTTTPHYWAKASH